MTRNTTKFTRDPDNTEFALVPVNARSGIVGYAILDRDALERLEADAVPTRWHLNTARGNGYVSCTNRAFKGGNQTVARLITGAGCGQAVRYHDGDRLNLRRANLYLTDGPSAKGKTPVAGPDFAQISEGLYNDQ
jgi:hypothetical protein